MLNLKYLISDDAGDFFSGMVIGIIHFLLQSTPDAARTPTLTIAVVAISNNQKCVDGLSWPPVAATPALSHSFSQTWSLIAAYRLHHLAQFRPGRLLMLHQLLRLVPVAYSALGYGRHGPSRFQDIVGI